MSEYTHPTRPTRILVVEDNPDVAALLRSVLVSYDYYVDVADDLSALQASRENLPDLILLDLMMPTMGGEEAVGRLKEMPETWDIPIVLMSGVGDLPQRATRLGIKDYLSKPFDLDDLLAVVQRALTTA